VSTLADLLVHIGVDTRGVDKGTDNIRRKFKDAFKAVSDGAKGIAPAVAGFGSLIPVALAGGAAVASLGATLAAAGIAAGVFGAVLGSSMTEIKETATQYEDLTDKIKLYGKMAEIQAARGEDNEKTLKKQRDAMLQLEARFKMLPPAQRRATENYLDMKDAWSEFVDANKPTTFGFLAKGYALIQTAVGKLQPFFDMGARAAGRLVDKLQGSVDGGLLDRLAATSGPALESLTSIIINVGTAIGRTFGNLGAKTGQGFLDWLDKATAKWAAWAGQSERGDGAAKMFQTLATQGPPVLATLRDIASAAVAVAQAVAPLAPITLAVAGALAALIAAVPPGVITALVAGWVAYGVALKAYAIYQAIATAATWANNAAWLASPVTWIILAIVAIIAGIVLLATKTKFFQTVWAATWGFLKMVGGWIKTVFVGYFKFMFAVLMTIIRGIWAGVKMYFGFWNGLFQKVKGWVVSAVTFIWNKWKSFVGFLISIPGKVSGKLRSMWDGLKAGFKVAINYIIGKWNSLQFSIPSFSILGKSFGGGTIGVPKIPQLAEGGIVKASPGGTLVNVGEGRHDEAVVPLGRGAQSVSRGEQAPPVIVIEGAETEFRRWLAKSIRVKGPIGGKALA
jgi:hypothetical protein